VTAPHITLAAARRIALRAQGFGEPRPAGRADRRHLRRVLDRMAVLQLDSVNVVCRSHYLPVFARLGHYDRDRLDDYLWRSGESFEYLAHEASVTPVEHHPPLRFRMQQGRWERGRRLEREEPAYLRHVLDQVEARGPLTISDLDGAGERTGPWWGYSKGKVALEWLYVTGRLAISARTPGFVSTYDLPERVIPAPVLAAPTPTRDESIDTLVRRAARALGVGTAADLADYFRLPIREVRASVARLASAGLLDEVRVDAWPGPAFLDPAAVRPRQVQGRALLSPFDPVVWFRPRAERLFGFRYRIEIYVPEERRVHGYYVLPFLLDGALVARVDLKADRRGGRLRVRGAFAQPDADPVHVADELAGALADLAAWLGLVEVVVERRGDLAPALRRAVGRG
jgi:uncharacterized protein YcaQ